MANDELPLMNNISTDEITPGWVCFHYDETLGEYVYVGMREGAVKKDEVKHGGFAVVVSGLSKGCGSSRETAPYAEKWAGIQLVIAKSIEKIYGQNSQNIGLLTSIMATSPNIISGGAFGLEGGLACTTVFLIACAIIVIRSRRSDEGPAAESINLV